MILLGPFAALLLQVPVEDHPVLPTTREVIINCPTQQTTRVVLPERVTGYRGDPSSEALLGLHVQTKPRAVISLQPKRYPSEGRFRVDGITRRLVLVFRTVPEGISREVRLRLVGPPSPHEQASAERSGTVTIPPAIGQTLPAHADADPVAAAVRSVNPSPASEQLEHGHQATAAAPAGDAEHLNVAQGRAAFEPPPAAAPPQDLMATPPSTPAQDVPGPAHVAAGLLDPGILTARVRSIGRVENLPGQRPVELVDALEGDRYLWLRFSIEDTKGARVERIWWEHGPIANYATEEVDHGKRLALVVQLPRRSDSGTALVTKHTRVHMKLSDGERTFPLSAPWLGAVVKDLFGW
jgi:hypothetical protein